MEDEADQSLAVGSDLDGLWDVSSLTPTWRRHRDRRIGRDLHPPRQSRVVAGWGDEPDRLAAKDAGRRFKRARWALLKNPTDLTDNQAVTLRTLRRRGGDLWRAYALEGPPSCHLRRRPLRR
jgi:hypothetical protein